MSNSLLLPCGDGKYRTYMDYKHYYAYYINNKEIEDKDEIVMWDSVFMVWNKYHVADQMAKSLSEFYDKNFAKQCADIYEHGKFSSLCFPWVFEDYYINPFKYIKTTVEAIKQQKIFDK